MVLRFKRSKAFLLVILAACVLVFLIPRMPWFTELKIIRCRDQLEASFARESSIYAEVAHDFLNSEEFPCFNRIGTSQHLTESMQEKIKELQRDCPVDIDSIYITDERYLQYPMNACVFSTTVERGDDVYAWVELVYSPDAVEQLFDDYQRGIENGIVTEIADNWYIMVHYGY